jgi:hypothetical protein
VIVSSSDAIAADDDTTSSVYLVFDPETGEFLEINDADRSKQKHAALEPTDAALARETKKVPLPVGLAIIAAVLAAYFGWARITATRLAGQEQRRDA